MEIKSFVRLPQGAIVAFLTEPDPELTICGMRKAISDGAEGFAIHICRLDHAYHNEEDLRKIFSYACDMPIMAINYRHADYNAGQSDEERVDELFAAIRAGASICDVTADIYDPSPFEISKKPEIIYKQKKLIDDMHSMGAEVMLSSHTWATMTLEQTLEHAKALEDRGPDMIKIACCVFSEDEALEAIRTTVALRREIKVPVLHVCMGQHGKLHRYISPLLGSHVAVCVPEYSRNSHKEQPLVRAEKAVLDNIDCRISRDEIIPLKVYS